MYSLKYVPDTRYDHKVLPRVYWRQRGDLSTESKLLFSACFLIQLVSPANSETSVSLASDIPRTADVAAASSGIPPYPASEQKGPVEFSCSTFPSFCIWHGVEVLSSRIGHWWLVPLLCKTLCVQVQKPFFPSLALDQTNTSG